MGEEGRRENGKGGEGRGRRGCFGRNVGSRMVHRGGELGWEKRDVGGKEPTYH